MSHQMQEIDYGFWGQAYSYQAYSSYNPYSFYKPTMTFKDRGILPTAYMPELNTGESGLGWGDTYYERSFSRDPGFPYEPGTTRSNSSYTYTPLYEYEKQLAQQYDFQLGEKYHNVNVDTTRRNITPRRDRDPIILDLDRNGQLDVTGKDNSTQDVNRQVNINTRNVRRGRRQFRETTRREEWDTLVNWNNKVDFDVTGDGQKDRTEWLKQGTNDGLLVIDNGSGKVTDGRQLFNETGINGEQNKYKNGWEKLSDLFDKDKNRVVEGNELNGLGVWVDKNGDARTDAGELKNLSDLRIVGIELPKDGSSSGSFIRERDAGYVETYSYSSTTRIV